MKFSYVIGLLCLTIQVNAQLKIDDFLGTYQCIRTRTGTGGTIQTTLIVYKTSNSDTVFRLKEPNHFEGPGYLHQDSSFDYGFYNCFGKFFWVDSIYFQYYHYNPSGGEYFHYYGRNVSVGMNSIVDQENLFDFTYHSDAKQIRVMTSSHISEIQCDLFSMAGSKLVSQSIHSGPGETNTLFTGYLPGGVFILRLSGGGYVRTGKIVVKK